MSNVNLFIWSCCRQPILDSDKYSWWFNCFDHLHRGNKLDINVSWEPSWTQPLSPIPFFELLDGRVFYLDVVGLYLQGIFSKGRITSNKYLETSLGFVRYFLYSLSRSVLLIIPFFICDTYHNQDQYLSVFCLFS